MTLGAPGLLALVVGMKNMVASASKPRIVPPAAATLAQLVFVLSSSFFINPPCILHDLESARLAGWRVLPLWLASVGLTGRSRHPDTPRYSRTMRGTRQPFNAQRIIKI